MTRRPDRTWARLGGLTVVLGLVGLMISPMGSSAFVPAQSGFTFPPSYGTPTVPSNVGAQGTQGPNVPVSTIGPVGVTLAVEGAHNAGPTGTNYPANGVFGSSAICVVTVQAYNGTYASHTNAAGDRVYLVNATTATNVSAITASTGIAQLSVPDGWYYLGVLQTGGTYVDSTTQVYVSGTSETFTRYLLPSTGWSVSVNNGGTTKGAYVIDASAQWYVRFGSANRSQTQIQVQLLNASNGNAVLGEASSLSNGSVLFTGLNTHYLYSANVIGYGNSISRLRYGELNVTAEIIPFDSLSLSGILSVGTGVSSLTLNTVAGTTILLGEFATAATPTDTEMNSWNMIESNAGVVTLFNASVSHSGTDTISVADHAWALDIAHGRDRVLAMGTNSGGGPVYPSPIGQNVVAFFSAYGGQVYPTSGAGWQVAEVQPPRSGTQGFDVWAQNVTSGSSPELSLNGTGGVGNMVWIEVPGRSGPVPAGFSIYGPNSWTGTTFSGTAPTSNGWSLSAPTTVTGGTFYLSAGPPSPIATNGYALTFSGVRLYLNLSHTNWSAGRLSFQNSTVIEMDSNPIFNGTYSSLWFNDSAFVGSFVGNTYKAGMALDFNACINSVIEYVNPYVGPIQSLYGTLRGDWFENDVDLSIANETIAQSTLFNQSLLLFDGDWAPLGSVYPSNVAFVSDVFEANSSLAMFGGFASQTRNLWFNSTIVNGTYLTLTTRNLYLSYDYMNVTLPNGGSGTYFESNAIRSQGYFSHVQMAEFLPTWESLSRLYASVLSTKWVLELPDTTNVTASTFAYDTTPSVNWTVYARNLTLYDDNVNANYTLGQVSAFSAAWPGTISSSWFGRLQFLAEWNLSANYTLMNTGGDAFIETQSGSTYLSHDYYPWLVYYDPWVNTQVFGSATRPNGAVFSVTNTTFGYSVFDYPTDSNLLPFFFNPGSADVIQDNNVLAPPFPKGTMVVEHDTFMAGGVGPTGPNQNGVIVGMIEPNIANYAEWDVWYNSPSYTLGFAPGQNPATYRQEPWTPDLALANGCASCTNTMSTVIGNWFLGLSNVSTPISVGYPPSVGGGPGKAALSGNHYFYDPVLPVTAAPAAGDLSPYMASYTGTAYVNAMAGASLISYEIPIASNATLTSETDTTYVFNTTVGQTTCSVPCSGFDNPPKSWSWGIAPDVNASGVTPVVGYSVGLAGGPQPNFPWHGYNYSEQVEPSYVEIGVNATRAPPVTLSFSDYVGGVIAPYQEYSVISYSPNGTPIGTQNLYANSAGIINVTYNPAIDPLAEVFEVEQVGANGGPVPYLIFTLTFILIMVTAIAVGLSGLIYGVKANRRAHRAERAARVTSARRRRPRW